MFIPFLAASAVTIAFAQLGAMSVKIGVLTMALQGTAIALLALIIAALAFHMWSRFKPA